MEKRVILLGASIASTIISVLFFFWGYLESTIPPLTPVSLSAGFRPWTKLVSKTLIVWVISFLWTVPLSYCCFQILNLIKKCWSKFVQ